MQRRRWQYFGWILAIGLTLPFATLAWARAIGGALIFPRNAPHLFLVALNFVPFLAVGLVALWALREPLEPSVRFVRRCSVIGSVLVLAAFCVNVLMRYWLSRSSMSSLVVLVYLPSRLFPWNNVWVFAAAGFGLGWLIGNVEQKHWRHNARVVRIANQVLALAYVAVNVVTSNFGKFNLPATPGIAFGTDLFVKETFLDAPLELSPITSMELRACGEDKQASITIVGAFGALFVATNGTVQSRIKFKNVVAYRAYAVDADGDGLCEFVKGAWGFGPVALIDHEGNTMWSYGDKSFDRDPTIEAGASPQDIVAYDVDGDGKREFLVPLLIVGANETAVLDMKGNVKEKLKFCVQNAATADVCANGTDQLIFVHCQSRTTQCAIEIRGRNLELLRQWAIAPPPQTYPPPAIVVARWPDAGGPWHALINYRQSIHIINLTDGKRVDEIPAKVEYDAEFTPVRFAAPNKPYLAVATRANRRQVLSIYNADKKLVYQETLRGGVHLMALPRSDSTERLLVSECGENWDGSRLCGKVWEYKLKNNEGSNR